MRQMMVRTQRINTGDQLGRYVVEARAQQAVRLHGYKMDLIYRTSADYQDQGDDLQLTSSLLAAPRTTNAVPGIGDTTLDALNRTRALVGYLHARWEIGGNGATGQIHEAPFVTTGWMPCDFLVPGLWITCGNIPVANTAVGMLTLHILMDWETVGAISLAALYTTYGIDSVDSTERQAVGEVDFNRAIGEGALPPLVG